MSTIAAQIQAAFKRQQESQPPISREQIVNEKTNRYLWFPAEDIPHNEATAGFVALMRERAAAVGLTDVAIASCWIERCRLVPVLAMPIWEEASAVPEELRVKGRNPKPNGEPSEYQYLVPPGHIFEAVMEQYQAWGLTELQVLRGGEPGDVLELQIDDTYFPERKDRMSVGYDGLPIDEIPKAYSVLIARINQVTDGLKNDARRSTLEKIARDMLRAIEVSKAFDLALVEFEENQKEFQYSAHGLRALTRLERKRKDHAINEMAVRQAQSMDAIPRLVETIAQGQAQAAGAKNEEIGEIVTAAVSTAMGIVMEKFGHLFQQKDAEAQEQKPEAPKTTEQPRKNNGR